MGFLDNAKAKLSDAVDKHGDKISDGLTKAGAAADAKTGGKYTAKIDAGIEKARGALDGLDGKNDDLTDTTAPTDPANPTTGQGPDVRP